MDERLKLRDNHIIKLQSELESYKIALNYFAAEGGQHAKDIIKNMLKEIEV